MHLGDHFEASVKRWCDRLALIEPESGLRVTYGQLLQRVRATDGWLDSLGIGEGDRIAFAVGNSVAALELLIGALYRRVIPVPCNPDLGPEQLRFVLNHCDSEFLFASHGHLQILKNALQDVPGHVRLIGVDRQLPLEMVESQLRPWEPKSWKPEDDAIMIYTSGTTGMPRGVVHTCASLLASVEGTAETFNLTEEDRFLCVLPVHHGNSINKIIATLFTGGTIVLPPRFKAGEYWRWVDDYECTWLAVVPSIVSQLIRVSGESTHPSVRFARCSSAPLPQSWSCEFEAKFAIPLLEGMGSTESGPLFSSPLPPIPRKIGSPGQAVGRQEVIVVDQAGERIVDGKEGSILVRGPSRMKGYYKDEAGTADVLTSDGWLRTGDVGYRDADGFFFITGRTKEIAIKAGVNVALREIDETLVRHPDVIDAVAVGVADRYLGEDIVAYVSLSSGSTFHETELLDFCIERLGYFKSPSTLRSVPEIPRSRNGKVQRSLLPNRFGVPQNAAGRCVALPVGEQAFVEPRTPIEVVILRVWSDHLEESTIGIHDDFFALGGFSLLAIRMLVPLRQQLGVAFSLTAIFDHPTVADLSLLVLAERLCRLDIPARHALIDEFPECGFLKEQSSPPDETIRDHLTALPLNVRGAIETRLLEEIPDCSSRNLLPIRQAGELCPLSFAQERLWFLTQYDPASAFYNTGDAVRLRGPLDVDALEEAIHTVVARHEILRVSFSKVEGRPLQRFRDRLRIKIAKQDLSSLPEPEKDRLVQEIVSDTLNRPYDLESEPLLRAAILCLGREEHIFVEARHHLVCDGWSLNVLFRDLEVIYQNLIEQNSTFALPELTIQYGDFAAWQRHQLQGEKLARESEYWRNRLRGMPTLLDLPTDKPRSHAVTNRGFRKSFSLGSELTNAVAKFSRMQKISPFMTLSAAFACLLHRYTAQNRFVIGLPFADRDRPELQTMVGLLIDTHVIPFSFDESASFRQIAMQARQEVAESYEHRDLPFELVVEAVKPERSPQHLPLCQVIVNWRESSSRMRNLKLEGLATEPFQRPEESAKFDLNITFSDASAGFSFEIEYRSDLFHDESIDRFAQHFRSLLKGATENPESLVKHLPLLTSAERDQLIVDWSSTSVGIPLDRSVAELFEEQVELHADAIALVFGDEQLTYEELNQRANQLAHHLIARGVGPETIVGLCLPRSIDMVVSLMAILKAGGAFLPLDADDPESRLRFILKDTDFKYLISNQKNNPRLREGAFERICMDADSATLSTMPVSNPSTRAKSRNLAYVLFTSGSTGRPKGVEVEHRSIVSLVCENHYATFGADRTFLQLAPIAFDASTFEIWGALLHGAKLVIAPPGLLDLKQLDRLFKRHRITTLWLTATLFNQIIDQSPRILQHVEEILTGGEALSVKHIRQAQAILGPDVKLINGYGPTEATTFTTCYPIPHAFEEGLDSVPIGRPIANTQVFVLDAHGNPQPIGVPGELHVGGEGLARGYLNRPELTSEKFIAKLFDYVPGNRLYRTGDLCRWRADGNLEFMGRTDEQVKLRGFRIEMGEVESTLKQLPEISQAAVVLREDNPGDKRLVAYCVSDRQKPLKASVLRDYLKDRLPAYMIPSAWVLLDVMPKMASGKIDRRQLPVPDYAVPDYARSTTETGYIAPRTELERQMACIWAELLGVDPIGIDDNFFDLGGHSLLVVRVSAKLLDELEVDVPLRLLFENPTIRELVDRISTQRSGTCQSRPAIAKNDADKNSLVPLSFAQQRLWFLDQLQGGSAVYNMSHAWRLQGSLNRPALERSLEAIIQRHQSLRTRFVLIDDSPLQLIDDPVRFALAYESLRSIDANKLETTIQERAYLEASRPFDLSTDLMVRARLLEVNDDEHVLLLTIHHIAADGWSLQLLWKELNAFYTNFCEDIRNGTKAGLPELPVQYADYTIWQRRQLQGERYTRLIDYWREQLQGICTLELPTDRPRPLMSDNHGERFLFSIKPQLLDALNQLGRAEGTTLHMTMLAAFQVLLSRHSGQEDIAVGVPTAGRNHIDVENLIGFFVNTLVLRLNLSGAPTFREVLGRVRQVSLDGYNHQDYPFDRLVDELHAERHLNRNPLFQVLFQVLNFPEKDLALGDLQVSRIASHKRRVRFDLEMHLRRRDNGLDGSVVYSSELFSVNTIERMVNDYVGLLESMVKDADQQVDRLPPFNDLSLERRLGRKTADETVNTEPPTQARPVVSVSAPSDDAGFVVPRTELETRLAAIWAEVLNLSQVGINENFFDLGGHSLSAIGLHSQIGKLTGKTLPIASIFQFGTIAQQAQLIEEAVFDQDPIKIIHLRTHGRGRPIFVMPGITGSVMISPRLYELIDSPTFGCQPCLERWNIEMFRDFRVTAGMLADAVKEQQTDGPYALMGYSYGGIMAYEVASVLQQRGEDIAMLAVLDAGPKNRRTRDPIARLTRYSRIARNVPFWLREEGRQFEWRDFSKRLAVFLRHQKRKIIERDFVTKFGDIWDEATISSQNVEIMRTAYDAFRDYEPGYFQGKLTLFRAKTLPLMSGSTKDRGWKRHVRELEIHAFDGDHRSILQSPQIEGLAIKINSLLNQ